MPEGRAANQAFSVDDTNPPANNNPPDSWHAHLDLVPPILNTAEFQTTFVLTGGETGAQFDALSATTTVVVAA